MGTFILSLSVSNPLYSLLITKKINLNNFFHIIDRIILFILGLIIIFYGLYIQEKIQNIINKGKLKLLYRLIQKNIEK